MAAQIGTDFTDVLELGEKWRKLGNKNGCKWMGMEYNLEAVLWARTHLATLDKMP